MGRYLADDVSLEETEILLQWLNEDSSRSEILKELQEAWDTSKPYPEKFYVDKEVALLKVRRTILNPSLSNSTSRSLAFYRWLALGCGVLVISVVLYMALLFWSGNDLIEIETSAAQRKEVVLPDGSKVWLNELSLLSYRAKLQGKDTRLVKLNGEAYFEIKSDPKKQFLIETGDVQIQAIESAVNVLQDPKGDVKVSVLTGNVFLVARDKLEQKMMLSQGEEGVNYKEGYMDKVSYKDLNFLSWKTRRLSFTNSTLNVVIAAIERTYGVKFYLKDPSLLSRKLTASFDQVTIEKVIAGMESLLDLNIEKAGSVYLVGKE